MNTAGIIAGGFLIYIVTILQLHCNYNATILQLTVASWTSQLVNRNAPFQMVLQTLQNGTFSILKDWYMNKARACQGFKY